jgi:hypothetical protein
VAFKPPHGERLRLMPQAPAHDESQTSRDRNFMKFSMQEAQDLQMMYLEMLPTNVLDTLNLDLALP